MIAIKNMEMPSCCGKCPLAESEYVLGLDSFYCNITDKMVDENEKDNDCPLVEIITCKDSEHNDEGSCDMDGCGVVERTESVQGAEALRGCDQQEMSAHLRMLQVQEETLHRAFHRDGAEGEESKT